MSKVFVLLKRDLQSFFTSPLIYILAAVFSGLMGYMFYSVFAMASEAKDVAINTAVMRPIFGNINTLFIFIIPLIGMKLISEEKKNHTLDLLLVSPLKDYQVVLAKLLTGALIITFLLFVTLIFPSILAFSGYSNWSTVVLGYLGAWLNGVSFLMFCLFVSSLTKNNVIAAVSGMFGILLFVSFNWTAQTSNNFIISQIFDYLGISGHFEPFSRGVIVSYDLLYYMSFIFVFWICTLKSLDSRNW